MSRNISRSSSKTIDNPPNDTQPPPALRKSQRLADANSKLAPRFVFSFNIMSQNYLLIYGRKQQKAETTTAGKFAFALSFCHKYLVS